MLGYESSCLIFNTVDELIGEDANINTYHGKVNSNETSCHDGHTRASQTTDSKAAIADGLREENYNVNPVQTGEENCNDNAVQTGGRNQNAKPSSSSDDSDSSSDDSDSDSEVSEHAICTERVI